MLPLRERILQASRVLIEQQGLNALSMREVARRAGVTHQAPYHHFADREAILAALIRIGFEELGDRLHAPLDAPGTTVEDAVRGCGEAYVGYAMAHPGMFRIMFRPELCDISRHPETQTAADHARAALTKLVAIAHGDADEAERQTMSTVYWSVVHGLADLIVDGEPGRALPDPAMRQAHVHAVLTRFTQGMLRLAGHGGGAAPD